LDCLEAAVQLGELAQEQVLYIRTEPEVLDFTNPGQAKLLIFSQNKKV